MTRRVGALALAMLLLGAAVHVRAQAAGSPSAEDIAQARDLFQRGVERLRASDWAAACDLLARSNALVETAQTHLNLALCSGNVGRLLDQSEHLRAFVRMAGPDIDPSRITEARQTIDALETRIPHVIVRVQGSAEEGFTLRVDGRVIPRPAWGTPRPVNPGEVHVEARGGPYLAFRSAVRVGEGQTAEVEVPLVARPHVVAVRAHVHEHRPVAPTEPRDHPVTSRWWFWTTIGAVVLVGGGLAVYFATRDSGGQTVAVDWPPGTLRFEALTASPERSAR